MDPATGHFWMFGGDSGPIRRCIPTPEFRDDTWRYDPRCDRWTRVDGDAHPSARSRSAYALDTRRRRLLVFGGRFRAGTSGNYTLLRDAWSLDLATGRWSELETMGTPPSARSNAAAAYDPRTDALVVYGGNTSVSGLTFTPQGDLWSLSLADNTWTRLAMGGPTARLFHSVALRDRSFYVYGGGGANAFMGPFYGDLWRYDLDGGDGWSRVSLTGSTASLGRRISAGLVAPATGDGVVLIAGHDDEALGNRNDVHAITAGGTVRRLREGDRFGRAGNGFCDFPAGFAVPDTDAPERRSAFVTALTADGNRAVIYGGKTDCGTAGDLWSVELATGAWTPLRGTAEGVSCARSGRMNCTSLCQ